MKETSSSPNDTSRPNELLKRRRVKCGLSQATLATLADVAPITVQRWEQKGQIPQPIHQEKVCRVLGASPAELGFSKIIGGSNQPESTTTSDFSEQSSAENTSESISPVEESDPIQNPLQNSHKAPCIQIHHTRFLLLGGAIALLFSFAIIGIGASYREQSPQKTLKTFCLSLQQQNYQTVYEQFSPQLQQQARSDLDGKIYVGCTATSCSTAEKSTSCKLILVAGNKRVYWRYIRLGQDAMDQWKITFWGTSYGEAPRQSPFLLKL